jgi:hypothetical protein
MNDHCDLDGLLALVTDATSGIGRAEQPPKPWPSMAQGLLHRRRPQ